MEKLPDFARGAVLGFVLFPLLVWVVIFMGIMICTVMNTKNITDSFTSKIFTPEMIRNNQKEIEKYHIYIAYEDKALNIGEHYQLSWGDAKTIYIKLKEA